MGNIPAKLTGKYQSYDINTPSQVTPPISTRKASVYHEHESVQRSPFGGAQRGASAATAAKYDTFNFNNSNFQAGSSSFDQSYQYAFQRHQQIEMVSRRLEMHNSNSVDDDEDEEDRHNGSYGRGARERTNVSDSVNSNTSARRLDGVRLEQVEDDSSDVEHQDHQHDDVDEDEDEDEGHYGRGGGRVDRDHYDKYELEHENESGIDSKRTDRDEDSTSKDHEDDFSNHSISVSIINEKGIDILPGEYCQHGEFLEDHLEDECERERERLGHRARAIDVMY